MTCLCSSVEADFKLDKSVKVWLFDVDRKQSFLFSFLAHFQEFVPMTYTSAHCMVWFPLISHRVNGTMSNGSQNINKLWRMSEFWDSCSVLNLYILIKLLPTERRCHVTAGVAKQANTSSVLLKWVRWGLATAWPRHWPHIRTCPLWVLAADVWLVWHAATSTILMKKLNLNLKVLLIYTLLMQTVCWNMSNMANKEAFYHRQISTVSTTSIILLFFFYFSRVRNPSVITLWC